MITHHGARVLEDHGVAPFPVAAGSTAFLASLERVLLGFIDSRPRVRQPLAGILKHVRRRFHVVTLFAFDGEVLAVEASTLVLVQQPTQDVLRHLTRRVGTMVAATAPHARDENNVTRSVIPCLHMVVARNTNTLDELTHHVHKVVLREDGALTDFGRPVVPAIELNVTLLGAVAQLALQIRN
jgi:hypothetical protein